MYIHTHSHTLIFETIVYNHICECKYTYIPAYTYINTHVQQYIYAYIVIYKEIHTHTDAYISVLHYHSKLVRPEDIKKKSKRL